MNQPQEMRPKDILGKWKFIAFTIVMVSSLVFFVSAVLPPVYSSETEFLILQKNLDIDAYRAAKSSEYAGSVLERVVGTTNFMDGVLQSRHDIEDNFGDDPKKRAKNWQKAVKAQSITNTGIITVTVLHKNREQGERIMSAIIEKLLFDGERFHGNDNILLKKIGGPVYYQKPEYPKVWLNTAVAGGLGLFLAIGLVIVVGENVDTWMYSKKSKRGSLHVIADRRPLRHKGTVAPREEQIDNSYIAPVEAEIWAHPEPQSQEIPLSQTETIGQRGPVDENAGSYKAGAPSVPVNSIKMPLEVSSAPVNPAEKPHTTDPAPQDTVKNMDYRERLKRIIGE